MRVFCYDFFLCSKLATKPKKGKINTYILLYLFEGHYWYFEEMTPFLCKQKTQTFLTLHVLVYQHFNGNLQTQFKSFWESIRHLLVQMWPEWGIVGALCRTSERRAFLRCNLLFPDERPSHNWPSPAYEASVEKACSLKGDYNGFTTDLTFSFATSPPSETHNSPLIKVPLVCYCAWFCQSCVNQWLIWDEIESFKAKWKTRSAVSQKKLHSCPTQEQNPDK